MALTPSQAEVILTGAAFGRSLSMECDIDRTLASGERFYHFEKSPESQGAWNMLRSKYDEAGWDVIVRTSYAVKTHGGIALEFVARSR